MYSVLLAEAPPVSYRGGADSVLQKGRGRGILIQSGMVAENRAPPRHETGGACNVLFR